METLPAVAALGGPIAQILAIILVAAFGALATVAWLVHKNNRAQITELQEALSKKEEMVVNKDSVIERRTEQLASLAQKTNEVLSASNVSVIRLRDTLESVQAEILRIKEKCNE